MVHQPSGKQTKNCYRDPKSPFWQYEFSIRGERERGSTRETTARDASAFVEARKASMRQRQAARVDSTGRRLKENITVAAACQLYEDKFPDGGCGPTVRYQLANLVAIICEHDDHRVLADVATADIQRYRLRRKTMLRAGGAPIKDSSINREVELARAVWRYADLLGYDIGNEPTWTKVIIKSAEVERKRELFADEERRLTLALTGINPDLAAMAEFAILSGQRKKAVVMLQWNQVDITARTATILLKTKGPEKRPHTFPLTARMMAIIESRPKVGPYIFTYECTRNAPPREDRPRRVAGVRFPFSVQGWTRQWKRALDDAGIADFRWHDLRHTAATRLLRRSGNLKAAQSLLGHTTLEQTAKYAHVTNDDLRNSMEDVDRGREPAGAVLQFGPKAVGFR